MGIFLRQNYNVKPSRWGSPADIEYAVKVNAEKVYGVDPDSIVLAMPLFWGLPCLDYSGKRNDGVNHGTYYKDGELEFDGDYIDCGNDNFFNLINNFVISVWLKTKYEDGELKTIFSKYTSVGGNKGYVLSLGRPNIGGKGTLIFFNGTTWKKSSTVAVNDGLWHLVTLVVDSDTCRYYVDGKTDGTDGGGTVSPPTSASALIGRQTNYLCNDFNGTIKDILLSNIIFSADQIALFHALPYGLYQPVIRMNYFLMPTKAQRKNWLGKFTVRRRI